MRNRTVTILVIAGMLGGALAAGAWLSADPVSASRLGHTNESHAAASSSDASAPLEARIRALEQAVSDERYARQLLQDELFVLTEELEALSAARASVAEETSSPLAQAVARTAVPMASDSDRRVARLLEAGFAPGQAEWIVQRESRLQMEALRARYDAERAGDVSGFYQSRNAASDALRNELGDADYERYLAANGRSTSVAIADVLQSSPAQRAGLRPGDRIESYGGKRIFSMSDLTRETMQGQPGEQVILNVVRDGVNMQVALPRGPVGISGGPRYSR